jgi:hypothetical protein
LQDKQGPGDSFFCPELLVAAQIHTNDPPVETPTTCYSQVQQGGASDAIYAHSTNHFYGASLIQRESSITDSSWRVSHHWATSKSMGSQKGSRSEQSHPFWTLGRPEESPTQVPREMCQDKLSFWHYNKQPPNLHCVTERMFLLFLGEPCWESVKVTRAVICPTFMCPSDRAVLIFYLPIQALPDHPERKQEKKPWWATQGPFCWFCQEVAFDLSWVTLSCS